MFDATGAFTKSFTPVDGGYLYYTSAKAGGKLVTVEEFEALAENWRRVAGPRGRWKAVGFVFLAFFIWTAISKAFALPDWADSTFTAFIVIAVSGWLLWASLATYRLVRDRPVMSPPRPIAQARRATRSALSWSLVIFVMLFSGAAFWGHLSSPDRSLRAWAWIVGSGAMLAAYLWIALQKLLDKRP